MRSLRRHRENHHFSLLSLTPITFDFNTISCYDGSYYATIAVVLYYPKTFEFVGPSMPTNHRHFLKVSLPLFRVCSPSKISSAIIKPPRRALQLSTLASIFSYYLKYLSYMTRALGMSASFVCIFSFFPHLVKGLGPTVSLSFRQIILVDPIISLSYNGTLSRRNIDVFQLYVCS
jgi:hypothetical protein